MPNAYLFLGTFLENDMQGFTELSTIQAKMISIAAALKLWKPTIK
jgi:hypothetical protein